MRKKNKKKAKKAILLRQLQYVKAYRKDMLDVLSKAKDYWDNVIFDWLTSYDIVLEEAVKSHMKWTDFMLDKWIKFWDIIDAFQQEVYDNYWIISAWMYCDIRAKTYNIRRPWSNRKAEDYFNIDYSTLNEQQKRDMNKIFNRFDI